MEVGWWALLVSLAGLGISAASFWRSRTPAPRWETNLKVQTLDDGERRVTGSAVNRGRGVAREASLAPDSTGLMRVLATHKASHAEFGEELSVTLSYGPEAEGDGAFLLTWRQEPNLHRRRTKRLPYSLKALPDPTSRRGRRS